MTETRPSGPDQESAPVSTMARGFRLIRRFVVTHPRPFAASIVGGTGWALLIVGSSYALGWVVDSVVRPEFRRPGSVSGGRVLAAAGVLVGVAVLRGLTVVVRRWYGSVTEARMQVTLRRQVVDRLLVAPMSYYRAKPTGELLAHADSDVNQSTMALMPLPLTVGFVALVVLALVSLLQADVYFAAVALVLFPTLALLSRRFTQKMERPAAQAQQELGVVSGVAHESFDGSLVVKTLGLEKREVERFALAADRLRTQRLVVARLASGFQPLIDTLPALGTIALLLVGAWRIGSGATSPGRLVEAVSLFGWLAFPVRVMGFLFQSIPAAVVSAERVDQVLATPPDPSAIGSGTPLPPGPLEVVFDDVRFAHDGSEVLNGVSFRVAPGETVALVGATGTGKSTLAGLLARLDDPDSGTITVGGADITLVDPSALRRAVSLVFQESFLFASPVRVNVGLDRELPQEYLDEIADRVRAGRFISRLSEGWDTVVGERGVTLSGGQRQRLALGRALARSPQVLVLDDATSAVDPTVEAQILGGLRGAVEATVLVVAHRLSTILSADRVVYLEGGRVAAAGAHAELKATVPGYEALVTAYENSGDADVVDAATEDEAVGRVSGPVH